MAYSTQEAIDSSVTANSSHNSGSHSHPASVSSSSSSSSSPSFYSSSYSSPSSSYLWYLLDFLDICIVKEVAISSKRIVIIIEDFIKI